MFENYSVSIRLSLTSLNYFKNLKSSLFAWLSTKYQNKTNVLPNKQILLSTFNLNPLQTSHP